MGKLDPDPNKFQFTLKAIRSLLKVAKNDKGIRAATGIQNERQASRYFEELETAFCCSLRKPGSNPVILTEEGHELARISREHEADFEIFQRKCLNLPRKVAIAGGDSVVNWVVLPALQSFSTEANCPLFSVRMGGTKGLIALVHASQVDFAIVPEKAKLEKNWRTEKIGTYEYWICCHKDLLAGRDLEKQETLSGLRFALIGDHWDLDFVEKASDAGIKLNTAIVCETFTHVVSLVETGSFAGILPLSTNSSLNTSFEWAKPPFMEGTDRTINLVWKNDRAHIRKHIHDIAEPLLKQLQEKLKVAQTAGFIKCQP